MCLVLAASGVAYSLVAAALVRRFGAAGSQVVRDPPGVTVLKPLHGAEACLFENLASFCDQDYPAPVQILLGVQDPGDAAVEAASRLVRERPGRDIRVIVTQEPRGPNPKIANLAGMEPHIRHEVLVVSDSDIAVGRDYLARTVAALDAPDIGLVTWLYRGAACTGAWARLAALAIDYHFLPGVLVGLKLGLARPSFGSTLALRRGTLAALGGFRAFLDRLADDYAIGAAVRAAGMGVAIPRATVAHACTERTLGELLRHELRWARTIRSIDPLGYAGSAITHALPLALIAALVDGFSALGIGVLLAALCSRVVLALQVEHTLRAGWSRWWLAPAREFLSFVVFVGCYFVGSVSWRGHRYEVHRDGSLAPLEKPAA